MGLFARKSGSLVGVDIGSAAVKLVELSRSGTPWRVEACAVEPLPADAVAARNIRDAKAVGEAIRRASKRAGPKARTAAVAVAGSATAIRTIAFDASLTDVELEVEVALEADRHLPYPIDEAALDFEPLHLSPDNPALVDVRLVACRQEHVKSREAALAHGGMKAGVVDVETYAMQRAAALPHGVDESVAVVDIGTATATLLVLEHGEAIFTREEPFDGGRLRRGHPGPGSASVARDEHGTKDAARERTLSETAFREHLLRLVSRLLRLFLSTGPHDPPARLLLAGGPASVPGLAEAATGRLGVPTAVADPFAGMAVSKRVDAEVLTRNAPALVTACGLALLGFARTNGDID